MGSKFSYDDLIVQRGNNGTIRLAADHYSLKFLPHRQVDVYSGVTFCWYYGPAKTYNTRDHNDKHTIEIVTRPMIKANNLLNYKSPVEGILYFAKTDKDGMLKLVEKPKRVDAIKALDKALEYIHKKVFDIDIDKNHSEIPVIFPMPILVDRIGEELVVETGHKTLMERLIIDRDK